MFLQLPLRKHMSCSFFGYNPGALHWILLMHGKVQIVTSVYFNLWNENNNTSCLIELLWELNLKMWAMYIEQCPGKWKLSINIIYCYCCYHHDHEYLWNMLGTLHVMRMARTFFAILRQINLQYTLCSLPSQWQEAILVFSDYVCDLWLHWVLYCVWIDLLFLKISFLVFCYSFFPSLFFWRIFISFLVCSSNKPDSMLNPGTTEWKQV